jgi:hypothetical protein
MYSIIVNKTVLSYQYFSTVHKSIWKTWRGYGIFKIVFIFVDQERQQNPFLLVIGCQSGANKNEIRIVFVCIRRMKATKMSKSRSHYSFLFLFLSRIRKGLRRLLFRLSLLSSTLHHIYLGQSRTYNAKINLSTKALK